MRTHETLCVCVHTFITIFMMLMSSIHIPTVELDIFTVILFSLYSRLVNNREIKLTLIIQRLLQYYSVSAAIVKIKYAK